LKYDLFGIGTPVIDHFAIVDEKFIEERGFVKEATNYVSRGELDRLQEETSRMALLTWPGDNARNVCEGISFMGGKAAYAGRVAGDSEGKMFERVLRHLGIDSYLEVGPGRTGKILTLITPGLRRTFVADLGNGEDYTSVPEDVIKRSRIFFLTSITLLRGKISEAVSRCMSVARESQVKISISLESTPMIRENRERLLPAVSKADVLFGNEDEISALTGENPRNGAEKLARSVPVVCVKMGGRGSLVVAGDRTIEVPPFPANVRDPTGAGDFYAAGFLLGFLRENTLEQCGRMGTRLASMVLENLGATLTDDESIIFNS